MSQPWILLLVLLVLAAGGCAWFTIAMRRRRENIWERFARHRGLKYETVEDRARVTGRVKDREVRLETINRSSDTGFLGIEVVRLSLGLHEELPTGMTVTSVPGWIAEVIRGLDEKSVATGDASFDKALVVEHNRPDEVNSYFTPSRRKTLVNLVDRAGDGRIGISENRLLWEVRQAAEDLSELEDRLQHLSSAADMLDSSSAN